MTGPSRRWASLVMVALAVVATAATSPAQPSAAPTVVDPLLGSVDLSADAPVAVHRVLLDIDPLPDSVDASPTLALGLQHRGQAPDQGSIRAALLPVDDRSEAVDEGTPLPAGSLLPAQGRWTLGCRIAVACVAQYAIVFEWVDAPQGGSATVDWQLAANLEFRVLAGFSGALPPAELTLAADESADIELTRASASVEAVRLDETDRVAAWRVDLELGDGDLTRDVAWPVVAMARITSTGRQLEGPVGEGRAPKDRRTEGRPAVPISIAVDGSRRGWVGEDSVTFWPFLGCLAEAPCKTAAIVDLAWQDGRPEAVHEGGWSIEVWAFQADGGTLPVSARVEGLELPPMVKGTAEGTFEIGAQPAEVEYRFTTTLEPPNEASDPWASRPVPASGLLRARVVQTAGAPLPEDIEIRLSVAGGGDNAQTLAGVRPGEEVVLAFTPRTECLECPPRGTITAQLVPSGRAAQDVRLSVTWKLTIGAWTTAPDGVATLAITRSAE